MWIELTAPVGDKKAGEFLDVAEDVARAYQAAGLAKDAGDGPDKIILKRSLDEFQATLNTVIKQTAASIRASTEGLRRPGVGGGIDVIRNEEDRRNGPGDFLRCVIVAGDFRNPEAAGKAHRKLTEGYKAQRVEGEGGAESRGMTEGTGSAGGYLTPVLYETQMLEVAAEDQVILPGATPVPLGAREVEYPALDQYQAPAAGQSAFFGGVAISRKKESTQRARTQFGLAKVILTANDMTAYTEIGRDLIEDATVPIDGHATRLIGGAIGWREDWESLNGNGQGQFLGVYNAPALIAFTRTTTGHFKYQDIFGMYTRLLSASKKKAVWVVHPYSVQELLQLQDPSGRFLMVPYNAGNQSSLGAANAGPGFSMLGLTVLESEKAPVLGAANDLLLIDRSKVYLGRRSGLEIGLSEHFLFDTDQIAIRAKVRNDAQPMLKKPITLADGASTVSGMVGLAA